MYNLGDFRTQVQNFETTWRDQVQRMLPPAMRSLSYVDYIESLLEGLQKASDDISVLESETRQRLPYNGQIMVLQAALNEIFGITFAPFIVVQTERGALGLPNFFYQEAEAIPTVAFYPEVDVPPEIPPYFDTELSGDGTRDFYVFVPAIYGTPEAIERVRAETQIYKIAGKLFEIIIY